MKTFKFLALFLIAYSLLNLAHAETKYKNAAYVKTDLQTMDWKEGKVTMGSLKGVAITSGSSNPAFNGEYIQNCFIRVVRMKDSSDVFAHCTLTDKDGDIQYLSAERRQGDVTNGSGGRGIITLQGGTGKFQGTSGSCDYNVKYLKDNWQTTESSCVMK